MRSAKPSLKARALRYLSAREHSRLELARKLARYAEETDDIEALLDWLETSKFLSSTRFAESLINRLAERFGASRILMELESHQIDLSGMTDLNYVKVKASVHGVSGKKNMVRQQRPQSSQHVNSGFYSSVAFLMQAYKWSCVGRAKVKKAKET